MKDSPIEFTEGGKSLVLKDPQYIEEADFDLWNDTLCLKGDQRGRISGSVFTPNAQPYSDNMRPVFLRDNDTGNHWSANWGPVYQKPDAYSFTVKRHSLSWHQEYKGISSNLDVSVPRSESLEAWRIRLRNLAGTTRQVQLTIAYPTGLLGLLSHESEITKPHFGILHNYFPYYVKIPDYEKMARRWNTTFFFPGKQPDSWTALERDFIGFSDWSSPQGITSAKLNQSHCHYERGLCGATYRIRLEPDETFSLEWIYGPAKTRAHALEVLEAYPPDGAFEKACAEQEQFWEAQSLPLEINSPDKPFDHYVNYWSPDRSIRIGRTFRFNPSPQARNAIQDTMALSLFDPVVARQRFKAIWTHQEPDGFMPHGLPMVPFAEVMPITLIPHKDTNVWGPIALDLYLRETGDNEFLDTEIPYTDGTKASLASHLEKGLHWLLSERSPRGLSLIGQGDWNDPLNMAGPEGKGESIWLSEALVHALEIWASICRRTGRSSTQWEAAAEQCRTAVRQHGWDGNWFLRAVSDEAHLIGSASNEQGSIFLNAQSWALMAAIPNEQQTRQIIDSVEQYLSTRIAPAVLAPPYSGMVKHVGKLTLKSPGTGENGSVYSHAALFWSYALYEAGYPEKAWKVLRNLVPGGPENPIQMAGQLPLYIPNFFRGPAAPDIFGKSSHSPNTGSAAWVYMTFMEKVAGFKADSDGLLIQPQLPTGWKHLSGIRRFRGTEYSFSIHKDSSLSEPEIRKDGNVCGRRIAWSSEDKKVRIDIRLPE